MNMETPTAKHPTTPKAGMNPQEKDANGGDAKDYLRAKRALTAVNFFVETNRLEPYAAVYLVDKMKWPKVDFGIVSLVMNVAMVAFQTPAGDLLDKLERGKKIITTLAIVVAAFTTVMVVWTANFWAILFGKTVEGICSTIFLPALMSLLLGISKNEDEVPKFIATTEVSNKIGSFIIVITCAAISYFTYPDVESMFYLLGAGGLAAAVFTFLIPESAIDHDRARQLDGAESTTGTDVAETDRETGEGDVERAQESGSGAKAAPSRYRDLVRNKSIALFAALTFTYHLANAGPAPLLAQYVASVTPDDTSLTWTSAIMILWFLPQAVTSFLMSYAIDRFDHKRLMVVAFVTVPVRCAMIALLVEFSSSPWALVSTQTLEGIGAGVYDVMIPVIVQKMTRGSGRFGFTFGFIVAMWRIGHGASVFLGEAIAHSFGYTASFSTLGAIGVLNLIVFVVFFNFESEPSPAGDDKEPEFRRTLSVASSTRDLMRCDSTARRVSFVSAGVSSRYLIETIADRDED